MERMRVLCGSLYLCRFVFPVPHLKLGHCFPDHALELVRWNPHKGEVDEVAVHVLSAHRAHAVRPLLLIVELAGAAVQEDGVQQRRHGLIHLPGLQRHLQHLRAAIHPRHSLHTLPGLCAHNPFINPRREIQIWSDPGSAPDQDDFSLNTEYTTFLKLLKSLSRSQKVIHNNNRGSVHPEYSLEHVCVVFFFSQQNGRLLIHKSVFVF